jgi:hypothetical protein
MLSHHWPFTASPSGRRKIIETIQLLHYFIGQGPTAELAAHVHLEEQVHLEDAIMLFWKLGIDVRSLSGKDFTVAYYRLARRYHPELNQNGLELMANIKLLARRS